MGIVIWVVDFVVVNVWIYFNVGSGDLLLYDFVLFYLVYGNGF